MELIYIAVAVLIIAVVIVLKRKKGGEEVPQGLQVFNENGNMILDITDITYQLYGSRVIVGSQYGSGTIYDSRIKAGETFIIPYNITLDGITPTNPQDEYYAQAFSIQPEFVISDGQITWQYGDAHALGAYAGMTILYGGKL